LSDRRAWSCAGFATLTYSFARITAALKMKVEDLRPQGASWRLRLHEKGGKHHSMPCHHALAEALHAYIAAADIAEDRKGWLFRTSRGHPAAVLSEQPMTQSDAWRMIRRRAVAAGIHAAIAALLFFAGLGSFVEFFRVPRPLESSGVHGDARPANESETRAAASGKSDTPPRRFED
jgi:integrase